VRAVGLDLGQKRIGVAVTDSGGILALPYRAIERSGDPVKDRATLASVVDELAAEIVVVGLPIALSGGIGTAARAATSEAVALGEVLAVPVVTFDERLTTVEAARRRSERADAERSAGVHNRTASGRGRAGRGQHGATGRAGRGRDGIDAEAAAIMLEAWLGANR
jgi:putative holliday junction resolvase